MPREIVGLDPTQLTVSEYVLDTLQPDQIRVKVDFAAPKHGTELHGFKNVPDQTPTYYDAETAENSSRGILRNSKTHSGRVYRPALFWSLFQKSVGEHPACVVKKWVKLEVSLKPNSFASAAICGAEVFISSDLMRSTST